MSDGEAVTTSNGAINRPQRIAGIEMRFLGFIFVVTMLIHASLNIWQISVAVAAVMCVMGRILSRKDPNIIRVLLTTWRQKACYDPLKRANFQMKVETEKRG